jgi:uncharacterized ferredoxin-like protein
MFSILGLPVWVYGLIDFDVSCTVLGLVIIVLAKAWFFDRMVWLYEDMKHQHDEYRTWEKA